MKKGIFLLFTFTAFLLNAESAFACQCVSQPINTEEEFSASVATSLREATIVFSGEVIEMDRFTVKFRVQRLWKGEFKDELILITGNYISESGLYVSSRCGHKFELGKSYLIFADGSGNNLKAVLCSWTGILSKAGRVTDELDRLGQLEKGSLLLKSEAHVGPFLLWQTTLSPERR